MDTPGKLTAVKISEAILDRAEMMPTTMQNVDLSGLFLLRNVMMNNTRQSKPYPILIHPLVTVETLKPPNAKNPVANTNASPLRRNST